jgi:NADH:ubiquinone oxidoreductase subunit 2 (subunit N)
MLSAVIAAFLYLRIIVQMYMIDADEDGVAAEPVAVAPRLPVPFGAKLAVGLAFVATLVFGFAPGPLASSSRDARATVTAEAK